VVDVAPRTDLWFLAAHDEYASRAVARRQPTDRTLSSSSVSDAEYVVQIRSGDAEAFRDMYLTYYTVCWETAFTYLQSAPAAEDVVHEVFLQLWRDRAQWTIRESIRAYIVSAIRHKALNVLRHERVARADAARVVATHDVGIQQNAPNAPDTGVEAREMVAVVRRLIAAMPPLRRDVVMLRWRHGLSVSEIAESLGITPNAVSIHLSRARDVIGPALRSSGR
jgi:RNA polymerase sigma-70 factor (family 1)